MPDDAQVDPSQTIAALRRELETSAAERDEALAQQAAISEVLQIINTSPGDLAPMFDAMLEKAMRLCQATGGALRSYDGDVFHAVAMRGMSTEFLEATRKVRAPPDSGLGRVERGEHVVQIGDFTDTSHPRAGTESWRWMTELGGIRTSLWVALRKEATLLGTFVLYRKEVRPFSDKEISLVQNFAAQAVIAMENARLLTETREALEQQTATAEVLQVINSSPGDLTPVFDAMLERAMRMCETEFGAIYIADGDSGVDLFRVAAVHGPPALTQSLAERGPTRPGAGSMLATHLRGEDVTQQSDIAVDSAVSPNRPAFVTLGGARSAASAALRKDGKLVGAIQVYRQEVRPFSDKQIALLQNFAAQAVIATANARLLTETREALEQQTATAEVLGVINSSPGDLAPVWDAMLEKATRLCEAASGILWTYDGSRFRAAAVHGATEEYVEWLHSLPDPVPSPSLARIASGEKIVRDDDLATAPGTVAYAHTLAGMRTGFLVALRKGDALLGAIRIFRQDPRPFSDKHIALVENFAAQAVIAMENARLLTETREALAQQTATAEVLQVINSSPGDLAPVFDAMLEKATRLCGAHTGHLVRYENGAFIRAASFGVPEESDELLPLNAPLPDAIVRDSVPVRMIAGRSIIHVPDLREDESYRVGAPVEVALVQAGIRTVLYVPLIKDQEVVGAFITHRLEVRPFSEKQIALLQNFAAQAVIAMENARLITETREALEQQTATVEVLGVINSSPGDLAPVFDAMLEKALRLCGAAYGALRMWDGEHLTRVAWRAPQGFEDVSPKAVAAAPGSLAERFVRGETVISISDLVDDANFQQSVGAQSLVRRGNARTFLGVALRKDERLLGTLVIYRQEVRPFTDKQIALLQNFAAQAVIAIENARLLTETREALEQQTATAEVLQVINSSPGNLAPVFDAMLEKAARLCEAPYGQLATYDGEFFRFVAVHGYAPYVEQQARERVPPSFGVTWPRLVSGERLVHMPDVRDTDIYRSGHERAQRFVEIGGGRSLLTVALRKDDILLGALSIYRQEVRPFSDKQIALLQNFAAQAVIAMENARLLTETREALEQQTATAEVLGVINSSPGDLTPVFDAILEKAHTLCGAAHGSLQLCDGENLHAVATHAVSDKFAEILRQGYRAADSPASRALIEGKRYIQIADCAEIDHPVFRSAAELSGIHTVLFVPLRRDDAFLGLISAARLEVRLFSEKQIALLQNFAAQAVIAMDNARLLTETREALEQQTATAEVLEVINSSPGNLVPVFEAMLERARRLCEPAFGVMLTWDGERFHRVAWRAASPEVIEATREPVIGPPGSPGYRIAHGEEVVSIADLAENEATRHAPAMRTWVRLGVHSYVAVALRKEERLLGAIVIYRLEVRPFTDKEIALLKNFAAQAVIAMENARLLGELRERTHDLEESLEYQTATSDVLQVISRSTFDLQPVLQTVLDTAVRLCRAGPSEIFRMEGGGYRFAVGHGMTPEYEELERTVVIHPDPGTLVGRTALERRVVHVLDAWTDPVYSQKEEARIGNFHTMLGVPLMREGEVAGVIALSRRVVEPFSEREIQLVTTFADQAVIAIENTRLITETREALEQQTATAEILEVINRSPGDLQPVFKVILEKAHRLCDIATGSLQIYDGERFRAAAVRGMPEAMADRLRQGYTPGPNLPNRRLLDGERYAHIPDLAKIDDPVARAVVAAGFRTLLCVALRKDDTLLGQIVSARAEVRPFSEKEIALLESFAAQAVIAMDNARLLNEIRQRQAELRVTFDNMGDGVAMFDSDQRLAAWNLNFQRILELPDALLAERPRVDDFVRYLATHGEYGAVDVEAEVRRLSERVGTQWSNERIRPDGRVIEVRSNPVPGGGVVLIYSDVTERKRAEAEIRAARDTAEKALQELQTAQASLLHAQKMAALGQLTAGIAHEIKNPLNFVNNFAELSGELLLELKETTAPAVAALGDDERAAVDEVVEMLRGNLDKIAEHGKRADGIVKSMLEHSRGVSGERRVVDLNALIEEALNLAYHGARAQDASFNITLERELDRGLAPTELAPQEMTRVFLNLFGNGFYATTKRQRDGVGPDFRPTLKVATRDLGDAVEVRVRDNGSGIAPEIKDRLFQPFVTTKPTGEGTGLGLSIAWDIVVQQHGGTIAVDSRVGEFTEFTVRLPRLR